MADNAALQELVERSRIAEVINSLFLSTDRRDWVSVRACFASEVPARRRSRPWPLDARVRPTSRGRAEWFTGLA